MDAAAGTLSAAEKKTIEFGLAVAILSSCPSPAPSAAADGCTKQRASKQLRLWQGACLGGLAEAGSRARPNPAASNHRRQQSEAAAAGGSFDNRRAAQAAELPYLHKNRNPTARCDVVVSPAAGPAQRLLASDSASDLRALGAVALSGCQSERARAVQKEALEGLWHGGCSPDMVSLFAKEMLEQVVLRGQGGCGQVYRHVLDLMVSITADVAAAASWACTDNAGAAAAPASKAAASTLLARRIDVGLAVSQALDATLVQLAAELRRGLGSTGTGRVTGTRRGRQQQRQLQQSPSEAIARAAAGLFFDAYEAAVAFLLRALSCLAEGDPERQEEARASLPSSSSSSSSSSPMRNRGEPLRPNQPPRGKQGSGGKQSSDETFGVRNRAPGQGTSTRQTTTTTTTTTTANTAAVCERMVERGVLPRGWDAGARRNAWAQRKLEVLVTTAFIRTACKPRMWAQQQQQQQSMADA